MSKNVAVFVDVANIFYAAKAAGVDIDYVTLLKSAVAGRDFVRAYAYTGLDPENENQRQFHAFLARSGYKVVSKDIRKYGDGKIKANLDIELVVDMMRTSRNLDIAVIVSGDGDFAPAIRAVQQMGVRCEVISFRGNTSSDLIEVADVFTDITQIARVEKGSSRSGRRVAAEGDLSMTEVPDKETEGAPRRRRGRGRGGERELQPVAAASSAAVLGAETSGMPGNLIVLPGEKLSRVAVTASSAPSADEVDEGDEFAAPEELEVGDAEGAGDAGELVGPISGAQDRALEAGEELDGDGRRRRRRRGGRGRGRGRGGEREALPVQPVAAGEEDEEVLDYETPRLPQASTFGSVWDSQLGVPSVPLAGTGDPADDEDDDEPAIPEYLLAERRGRNQRSPAGPGAARRPGGGRMQGTGRTARPGSYQSAIDRERFGRSGSSSLGPGYGGPRRDDQRRDDRGRSDRPRGPRREDRVRETAVPATSRPSNGDPWSEVPPEVEELLRAELARRGGGGSAVRDRETSVEPTSRVGEKGIGELEPEETRDVPAEVTESVATETQVAATPPATVAPGAPAPRVRRAPRRTAAVPVGTDPETAAAGVGADDASGTDRGTQLGAGLEAAATSEVEAKPRRRVTRRKTATSEEQEAAGGATTVGTARASAEPVDGAEAADVEPAPRRRAVRRRTTAAEDGEAAGRPEVASVSSEGDALPATPAATGEAAEAAPRRRTTRRRKIGEEEQA